MKYLKYQPYHLELDQKEILHQTGCREDNPIYKEACRLYRPILEHMKRGLNAQAVIAEDQKLLYCIMTIGEQASLLPETYFEKEQYLEGILANGIADGYLFAMDKLLEKEVREYACGLQLGISKRLEAPEDYSLEKHKEILEYCQAEQDLHMTVTEGGMLWPLKSMCIVYSLTENESQMHTAHDCGQCKNVECGYRKIKS